MRKVKIRAGKERLGEMALSYNEYRNLWESLNELQKQSVKDKAAWEGMTTWAVCNEYPEIWNDPHRLEVAAQVLAARSKAEAGA